eukprot:scaffold3893_cov89-Skeletonema_dohrnii-CCMP3373.AAC.2
MVHNNLPAAAPDTAGDHAPPAAAAAPSLNESEVAVASGAPTAAAAGDDAAGEVAAGLANPVVLTTDRRPGGNDYLTLLSFQQQMVRNDERYNKKILESYNANQKNVLESYNANHKMIAELADKCFGAIKLLIEKVDDNEQRSSRRMDNIEGSLAKKLVKLQETSDRKFEDLLERQVRLEERYGNGDLDAKVKGTASQKKSEKPAPPVTRSSTSRAKESTPARRTGRKLARSNGNAMYRLELKSKDNSFTYVVCTLAIATPTPTYNITPLSSRNPPCTDYIRTLLSFLRLQNIMLYQEIEAYGITTTCPPLG